MKILPFIISALLILSSTGCANYFQTPKNAEIFVETPLASKLTIKHIQVNVPKGFNVIDKDLEVRLDYPASYLDTKGGNFLLTITNRAGETKVIHNNQEVHSNFFEKDEMYSGKSKVEAQMSPNAKYVAYAVRSKIDRKIYAQGTLVTSTKDWSMWWEINDEGKVRLAPAEEFMKPRCADFELPKDIPGLTDGERKIPGGTKVKNCEDYLINITNKVDLLKSRAIYNGKVIYEGQIRMGNISDNGKHYAYIIMDTEKRQDTLIVDGREVMTAPYLTQVTVTNNGDSMVLGGKIQFDPRTQVPEISPQEVYRNGKLVFTNNNDKEQLLYQADHSGTSYIIYTDKEWILHDGTRIVRTPEAQVALDGTTVYHYYFSTSTMK